MDLALQFVLFNPDGFTPSVIGMVIALVTLLIASALVSGSEVAFFSLSPKDLDELEHETDRVSITILNLVKEPRELLATILISNNFINVAIILLSSMISSSIIQPTSIEVFGWIITSGTVQFILDVVVITFLILLFGEVIPKVYASRFPINLLRKTVLTLRVINNFLTAIKITPLLVKSTNIFERQEKEKVQNVTMDDLQHALDLTSKKEMEKEDHKILEGVVRFGNTDVKQIMTPRVKAALLEVETPFSEVVDFIKETKFSRIPVFEESVDVIKGVLYAKDLLPHLDKSSMDWFQFVREPFFVPENKKIDDLLKEFQSKKTHIAMVVDEYGGVSGLVTLEDVIEEIVGDISDEFDDEDLYYSKLSDNTFVFEGVTSLKNMYRALGVSGDVFEEVKGEADSVAGFVLEIAGRIPMKGETIKFRNYSFEIESADRRRIKSIKVIVNSDEQRD